MKLFGQFLLTVYIKSILILESKKNLKSWLTQVAPDPAEPGDNAARNLQSKVTISECWICKPAGSGEQIVSQQNRNYRRKKIVSWQFTLFQRIKKGMA